MVCVETPIAPARVAMGNASKVVASRGEWAWEMNATVSFRRLYFSGACALRVHSYPVW
jgi:hypothetical protein